MMRRIDRALGVFFVSICAALSLAVLPVCAQDASTQSVSAQDASTQSVNAQDAGTQSVSVQDADTQTGYQAVIEDECDLFTEDEEQSLMDTMQQITEYGNVMLVSARPLLSVFTDEYAQDRYDQEFGNTSGTILLFDMSHRNLWIYSRGNVYDVITDNYAETITDNVYRLASDENYYDCARKAFSQELTLLRGGRIEQPMKYITNALMAAALAALIHFLILALQRQSLRPSTKEEPEVVNKPVLKISRGKLTERRTHITDNGDGGSFGGGGGGGSSGGGGGHGF